MAGRDNCGHHPEPANQGPSGEAAASTGKRTTRSDRLRDSPQKAMHEELMEQVVTQENATAAWLAVKRNAGAPGIDGMTTGQLRDHVRAHWETIRAKLLAGTYVARRVRHLGVPQTHRGGGGPGLPTA